MFASQCSIRTGKSIIFTYYTNSTFYSQQSASETCGQALALLEVCGLQTVHHTIQFTSAAAVRQFAPHHIDRVQYVCSGQLKALQLQGRCVHDHAVCTYALNSEAHAESAATSLVLGIDVKYFEYEELYLVS